MTDKIATLPDGTKVVRLNRSLAGHGPDIAEIRLRPPGWAELRKYGDPTALIIADGAALPQEDLAIVEQYLVALSGHDALTFDRVKDIEDALALKQAVCDFFWVASAKLRGTSSTHSSSASTPSPSATSSA